MKKKYKIQATLSGWATVSCSYDDLDEEERDEYLEDMDCGDYDYSAGNSGASFYNDYEFEVETDLDPTSKEFEKLVKETASCEVDRGNLEILDSEDDLEDWKIIE
ncbi:MAG: hypothetical protein IKK93_07285 [Campylobacter sp.]|nr:hypothetical protein [Campylobacter sp.]